MPDVTREQEATIARLALEHGSVKVTAMDNEHVHVAPMSAPAVLVDSDGNVEPLIPEGAYVQLPLDLLRRLLGADVVDPAVADAVTRTYPDHGLATILGDDIRARIAELLATSETMAKGLA